MMMCFACLIVNEDPTQWTGLPAAITPRFRVTIPGFTSLARKLLMLSPKTETEKITGFFLRSRKLVDLLLMLEHVRLKELLSFLCGSHHIFGCCYAKTASTGMPLCAIGEYFPSLRISSLKVKQRITFLVQRFCPLAWSPCV